MKPSKTPDLAILRDPRVAEALLGGTVAAVARAQQIGKVVRSPDHKKFRIDFGGLRKPRYLTSFRGQRFETAELAELILARIRAEFARLGDLEAAVLTVAPSGRRGGMRPFMDRWLELKRSEEASEDRSPTYLRELERWFGPEGHVGAWWGMRAITETDPFAIEEYTRWLADRRKKNGRRLSPKTRWNVMGALHAFLMWLARRHPAVREPVEFPWPKVPEPDVNVISVETQAALLRAIPEPRRGVFLALALMGLRPGEAVALDVGDYRDGWLTVSKARKGERLTSPIRGTKSGKVKRLPVPAELRAWIEKHHTKESLLKGGALFPNPEARVDQNPERRWSAPALRRLWLKACGEVGVRVSIYQGTKHAFATDAIRRGVQERSLQAFLGHADLRSTRRYARLGDQALVDVLPRKSDTGSRRK